MHLVIDGYNLIRQSPTFRAAESQGLDVGRQTLIDYLSTYRKFKHHKITVIFDGENSFHLSSQKEVIGGITVIYSGLGQKADDLIKKMVQKDPSLVIVTSDKEIIDFAQRHRATTVSSQEFLAKLEMIYYMDIKGIDEEDESPRKIAPIKKGPSRRISKREKKKRRVLKKL